MALLTLHQLGIQVLDGGLRLGQTSWQLLSLIMRGELSWWLFVLYLVEMIIVERDDVVFLGESPPPLESLPGGET